MSSILSPVQENMFAHLEFHLSWQTTASAVYHDVGPPHPFYLHKISVIHAELETFIIKANSAEIIASSPDTYRNSVQDRESGKSNSTHVSILQGTASPECITPLPSIHPNPYLGLTPPHTCATNTQR